MMMLTNVFGSARAYRKLAQYKNCSKYRKSYERECISGFMSTSDVLKVLKIRRVQFENFQNITSDHKSRNARASSYDFLFIIYSTKLLLRSSLHALRTTSKALQWFPKYSHVLFEPIKNIML